MNIKNRGVVVVVKKMAKKTRKRKKKWALGKKNRPKKAERANFFGPFEKKTPRKSTKKILIGFE